MNSRTGLPSPRLKTRDRSGLNLRSGKGGPNRGCRCPLWVKSGHVQCNYGDVRFVPCVDGSELARTFFTFAALVGAAMCSAFKCGTRGRWP